MRHLENIIIVGRCKLIHIVIIGRRLLSPLFKLLSIEDTRDNATVAVAGEAVAPQGR